MSAAELGTIIVQGPSRECCTEMVLEALRAIRLRARSEDRRSDWRTAISGAAIEAEIAWLISRGGAPNPLPAENTGGRRGVRFYNLTDGVPNQGC